MQDLRDQVFDGLVRTNEKVYDLLTLGRDLPQAIGGDVKSFPFMYIDWDHPERNVYHVTEEFAVERTGTKECYRPDIVLFVNGIPLVVIECKKPDLGPDKKPPVEQAISQHLRNQKEDGIPRLFLYSQLLLAVSKNEAMFGTTATPLKFWAEWHEERNRDAEIAEIINQPWLPEEKDRLFADRPNHVRRHFDELEAAGGRQVTEQDRTIWALCRPERLLELAERFTLFDAGEKKITRYQQYFTVKSIMDRIRALDSGRRRGGVVWHTQGSGKSLTMVMLAKAIAMPDGIPDYKIVLVTDRTDLDDQIYKTFRACGVAMEQATTGANLVEMLGGGKNRLVTTVINKFDAAVGKSGVQATDPNIFVLVDEAHRTQYKAFHAKMRRVLPNACYIGFTGTPVMKRDKNTVEKFGGLILPVYTITDAMRDKAVVRLLYEGRHVAQRVDRRAIDEWFDRITEPLSEQQRADLKRKYAREDMLFQADPVVKAIAWDVHEHYRNHWQGTGLKAQLVAPTKATALKYREYLDEFGGVNCEVLISGPDEREGEEDIYAENREPVIRFWKAMMERYGTEKEYQRQLINAFKFGDPADPEAKAPEIIIVVHKLLTGFDAPCNTVLYLARKLKEHNILQAIARVNRLHDKKEYGYVLDYRGILEDMHHALDLYSKLAEYDPADLEGTLTDVRAVIAELPQRHAAVRDVFKEVVNKRDEEEYELLLGDEERRMDFYDRFSAYARTLAIALSSEAFLEETPDRKVTEYKRDLKFFAELRYAVRRRYAEVVAFSEYEPKIKKLLDTYLGTGKVEIVVGKIDLFDRAEREKALGEAVGDTAKADLIAHNTMRVIDEHWEEDPAFYEKFSKMLQDAIDANRAGRLREAAYLQAAMKVEGAVLTHTDEDTPAALRSKDLAVRFFRNIRDVFGHLAGDGVDAQAVSAEASEAIERIVLNRRIVNWTTNVDVQNQMRQEIEDCLLELAARLGVTLPFDDLDTIMDKCIDIAKVRVP
jgi:type I restriction enzyme R subunit